MKQAILSISSLCMFCAVCSQLTSDCRYLNTVRMLVGMHVFLTVINLMEKLILTLK